MSGYLLDTNVLSELRKGKKADANVVTWFEAADNEELFVSVLVLGEIRNGIELIRAKDPSQARVLERWHAGLSVAYGDRLLPVTAGIAERWGKLNVPDPLPVVDGLMAATALEYDLTLVTRNTQDVARTPVRHLNPFHAR